MAYCVFRDPAVGLRSLYQSICESIQSSESNSHDGKVEPAMDWGPPVLLVDDLSVLLSLGVTAEAVLDFSHYCRTTVCAKLQVCTGTLLRNSDGT